MPAPFRPTLVTTDSHAIGKQASTTAIMTLTGLIALRSAHFQDVSFTVIPPLTSVPQLRCNHQLDC